MAVTDDFERLAISVIRVDRERRQRREIKLDGIDASIREKGVLQPIIVERREDGEVWLIAGERRLEGSRAAGVLDIPVRWAESLSPLERELIELIENVKRLDLDWQDQCTGVARVHELNIERDPDWTMGETAQECALTLGTISLYLSVARELSDDRVRTATTVREAYNLLGRRAARASATELQKLLEPIPLARSVAVPRNELNDPLHPTSSARPIPEAAAAIAELPRPPAPAESILNLDFVQWAAEYEGPLFNLIHVDFPYGINVFGGAGQFGKQDYDTGYADQGDVYWNLLDAFCASLDRFCSISAHVVWWFSDQWEIEHRTREIFAARAPSLEIARHKLIWFKSDNVGIAADATRDFRHVHETALFLRRGKRQLSRAAIANTYAAPTNKKLHPATKPEPMLRHFFQALVDETTLMLDPTCGSGASLLAAESLGAVRVLGLELDPQYCESARAELGMSRTLRSAVR